MKLNYSWQVGGLGACVLSFDVVIVNSFILYGLSPATGRKKTMKEFRVELAQLIGSYNSCRYGGTPQASSASQPKRMKIPHYPSKSSRGRCKACYKDGRMSTTTWWCNECQLRLPHRRPLNWLFFEASSLKRPLWPVTLTTLTLSIITFSSSCTFIPHPSLLYLPCQLDAYYEQQQCQKQFKECEHFHGVRLTPFSTLRVKQCNCD